MKVFNLHKHSGYYLTAENWISIDPDTKMEIICFSLTIKNFKLLRDYYNSLPPEDIENHHHLKTSFNNFSFTDADLYNSGLEIQNGTGNPEGLLIPLNSVKDSEKMFTFDRIHPSDDPNRISKYSIDYNDRVYSLAKRLDSLLIELSERENALKI